MPIFNERATVEAVIRRVMESPLPAQAAREIVAVDDGSTDGTAEILARLAGEFPLRIARHGAGTAYFDRYMRENLVARQEVVASITSENGTFGDTRSSICAVQVNGDRMTLEKDATTVSYGAHADAQLVTCRRAPDAQANDQVLVLFEKGHYTLDQNGTWDTLGMRGTCSPGAKFAGSGAADQILPGP